MNIVEQMKSDEGVSPVIAVILMVAITVVLAATVYVWVSGFASDQSGPEQASATAKGIDLDDDGDVEWLQLQLTSAENGPYDSDDATVSVTDSNGESLAEDTHVCEEAQANTTDACDTAETQVFTTMSPGWDAGESLWVPCQDVGNHIISVSVRGTTILDTSVNCGEQPSDA